MRKEANIMSRFKNVLLGVDDLAWITDDLHQAFWLIERVPAHFNLALGNRHGQIKPVIFKSDTAEALQYLPPRERSIGLLEYIYKEREIADDELKKMNADLAKQWAHDRDKYGAYIQWLSRNDSQEKVTTLLNESKRKHAEMPDVETFFNRYEFPLDKVTSSQLGKIKLFIWIQAGRRNELLPHLLSSVKQKYNKNAHKERNPHKKQFNLMLTKKLIEKLDRHANSIEASRSEIVEGLIKLYLDNVAETRKQNRSSTRLDPNERTLIERHIFGQLGNIRLTENTESKEPDTESEHEEESAAANPSDALNHSSHDTLPNEPETEPEASIKEAPNGPKEVTIEAAIQAATDAVTEAVTEAVTNAMTKVATDAAAKAVAEALAKAALDTETTKDRLAAQPSIVSEINPNEDEAIATMPVEQPNTDSSEQPPVFQPKGEEDEHSSSHDAISLDESQTNQIQENQPTEASEATAPVEQPNTDSSEQPPVFQPKGEEDEHSSSHDAISLDESQTNQIQENQPTEASEATAPVEQPNTDSSEQPPVFEFENEEDEERYQLSITNQPTEK